MNPVNPIQETPITVRKKTVALSNGRDFTIGKLREVLKQLQLDGKIKITDKELDDLQYLKSIKEVHTVEGGKGFKLDPTTKQEEVSVSENKLDGTSTDQAEKDDSAKKKTDYVLYLDENKGVINALRLAMKSSDELSEGIHYLDEAYKKSPDFTGEQGRVHSILTNVIEILDRGFNRRTTLTSWGLYAYLKSAGLKEDDFGPIKARVEDPNLAPDFIKKYTEYLKLKSIEPQKAIEIFDSEDDRRIAQLFSKTSDFYNSFSLGFVKEFPKIFSIENIALPIVNRIFTWIGGENNFASRIIEKIMVINPWLNEFAENLGNYLPEVEKLQAVLKKTPEEVSIEESRSNTLAEIELSGFENIHEYSLNKIVGKVDDAAARLLGKGNTVSSIVLGQILDKCAGKTYDGFIKDYRDNPGFVKKFHNYLANGSFDGDGKEVLENWWDKSVANIVKFAVRAVDSFSNETLKKITNYFGIANAVINPVVPFVSLFVRKGPLAWILHFTRDVLPIFNDLFVDHIANFRKEVVDIKEVTKDEVVRKLFPDLTEGVRPFIDSMTGVWNTVKEFSDKMRSVKRADIATETT